MPRAMEITTPLGDDVLLFHGMHMREEMGRLFEMQLDLLAPTKDKEINFDDILGKNVTVKLVLPDDSTRHFNGYVTRFVAGGRAYGRYRQYLAVVRPWLWFLTRTADCRIFQDMTVPDIVKKVFGDEPTNDFKVELTGKYRKWTYCVQYRETDFNFVSRLMEEEGISYYVKHTDGHNTVVLTDSTGKHTATPGYETIPFISPEEVVRPELEHVSGWHVTRDVRSGVWAHTDYDFERPGVKLLTQKAGSRAFAPSPYEVYDYPGHYIQKADGEQYAAVRIDEVGGSQFETAQAVTNAKGVCAGSLFTLDKCPREDQNREYLVLAASHDLEFSGYEAMPEGSGTGYRCSFVAMSSEQQFRPARTTPKPFVQGPQTAMVVGPGGDEIYTDKFGRVKVQFHWDRYGKKDENSSCWIRVSHPEAGKGWGSVSIPRIGQEVIVDFLEGDPDQPIITGRVYNGESLPPFGFPAGAVVSGVKSQTHKGSGYNELSMDDTAGKEKITIHGQYDMNSTIEHDETHLIKHDRTKTIDNDETTHVKHDRTETVDNNETIAVHGNRTETVDKDETITIHGSRSISVDKSESATVLLQRTHTVGINETITVGAAQEITVGGLQTITVGAAQVISAGAVQTISAVASQTLNAGANQGINVGGNQNVSIGKNASMTIAADENHVVSGKRQSSVSKDDTLNVTKNLAITAGESVTITTGDASIAMKKDGTITIKGKNITIEGSGKINIKASSDIIMKGSKIVQN